MCKHPAVFCVTSWALSGNFRQLLGRSSGNSWQFQVISGNCRVQKPRGTHQLELMQERLRIAHLKEGTATRRRPTTGHKLLQHVVSYHMTLFCKPREKAVAVSGVLSGFHKGNSCKSKENLGKLSRIATCIRFCAFGHRESKLAPSLVNTALDLGPL